MHVSHGMQSLSDGGPVSKGGWGVQGVWTDPLPHKIWSSAQSMIVGLR